MTRGKGKLNWRVRHPPKPNDRPLAGLALVGTLGNLASRNLTKCRKITDDGAAHLAQLRQLTSLALAGCVNITDAGQHTRALCV